MKTYLYLGEKQWADAWVNGGWIPIKPASNYLSDERVGVMTPDENLIHTGEVPLPSLRQYGFDLSGRDITLSNNKVITHNPDGSTTVTKVPDLTNGSYYKEDGLILSFCNHLSPDTAHRFEKVICVEIADIRETKKEIDKQLGIIGKMKKCTYTGDHQRNHFLKFQDDAWQDEFRIFWLSQRGETWVTVSPGTAKIIWTLE